MKVVLTAPSPGSRTARPRNRPMAKTPPQMASDAITYGTGFRSGKGDWVAVILLTPEDVQLCFIEVDP